MRRILATFEPEQIIDHPWRIFKEWRDFRESERYLQEMKNTLPSDDEEYDLSDITLFNSQNSSSFSKHCFLPASLFIWELIAYYLALQNAIDSTTQATALDL